MAKVKNIVKWPSLLDFTEAMVRKQGWSTPSLCLNKNNYYRTLKFLKRSSLLEFSEVLKSEQGSKDLVKLSVVLTPFLSLKTINITEPLNF